MALQMLNASWHAETEYNGTSNVQCTRRRKCKSKGMVISYNTTAYKRVITFALLFMFLLIFLHVVFLTDYLPR